jgi:hypothetical protein
VERENPWSLTRSYELVAPARPNTFLIALGDGPPLAKIKFHCATQARPRDLPRIRPIPAVAELFLRGRHVSAFRRNRGLVAAGCLGFITSDRVGAGRTLLEGNSPVF